LVTLFSCLWVTTVTEEVVGVFVRFGRFISKYLIRNNIGVFVLKLMC
jgi:hypothetical protein